MRRISKADDYDIQTRTLCKYLVEVTLEDYNFLRVKPSLIAAVGMYTSRRMLGGDWVSNSHRPRVATRLPGSRVCRAGTQ